MNVFKNVAELVGKTPLLELTNIEKEEGLGATVLAKVEFFNPGGSVKDRVAKEMIEVAEANGTLKAGGTIIEPTSGNTGLGLAAIAAAKNYKMILVMPDTMSIERIKLAKAYGAEVVLTPGAKGMTGAIEEADKIHENTPGSIIAGQFVNPANPNAHYKSTGPEIIEDTEGKVDIFVSAAGTGGTVTGTGRYLKEQNPAVKIIAVEPAGSPVLSGGQAGPHKIQGIGAGFVPEVLDTDLLDEVITVSDDDAFAMGARLGRTEGILVGISAGAAACAAVQVAKRPENAGKTIVVLLPDTGERYLSTTMFGE